jgi:hypothetical protein
LRRSSSKQLFNFHLLATILGLPPTLQTLQGMEEVCEAATVYGETDILAKSRDG